jgi:hypothetical protein
VLLTNKLNGKETKMSATIETNQELDFGTTEQRVLNKGARASIERDGFIISVRLTDTWSSYRSNYPKVRVSVYGENDVDFTEANELSTAAGDHMRGASVEADKAWDKANRQVVKNQKALAAEAIGKFDEINFLEGVKFNFSKYCFCSCPCSPGLIGEARPFINVPTEVSNYNSETDGWDNSVEMRSYQVASVSIEKIKES